MTIPEFIERLKETPRRWFLRNGVVLRFQDDFPASFGAVGCPICVVAGARKEIRWWMYHEKLGLSEEDARVIAYATDRWTDEDLQSVEGAKELRRMLLAATEVYISRGTVTYKMNFLPDDTVH